MITDHYNRTVDVLRIADDAGPTQSYAPHLSDVACHIQPLDDAYAEGLTGAYGKDWLMFCAVADILEGDEIVEGDVTYRVVGIESFHFRGEDKHMEIRIRKSLP